MNYWLLALTFLSVNLDFFFMLLFLLKRAKVYQVMLGYLFGTMVLMTLSFLVGKVLAAFLPEWSLGILGILPIWLAFRQDDDDDGQKSTGAPVWNVFITYLSVCSGCNLSIFLPVLAGETLPHFGMTLLFIGTLTVLVVLVIKLIGDIPVVARVMNRYGARLMQVCYIAIGLYVFWDSGLITHVLSWL